MTTPKKVVVVSNFTDPEASEEDVRLAEMLSTYAPSLTSDIKTLSASELQEDAVYVFRCIFGDSGTVQADIAPLYTELEKRNIAYINTWSGKGDQQGKSYLAELYDLGYPVVPTFLKTEEALNYPADEFIIKPLVGGSSKNQQELRKDELVNVSTTASVIQPVIRFKFETSYIFIDNEYQHALRTRNERWDLVMHDVKAEELALAKNFVEWNPIKGVQRVDCLWTLDDTLLLLELEDWCPFLSLFETDNVPVEEFVKNLAVSLGIA